MIKIETNRQNVNVDMNNKLKAHNDRHTIGKYQRVGTLYVGICRMHASRSTY